MRARLESEGSRKRCLSGQNIEAAAAKDENCARGNDSAHEKQGTDLPSPPPADAEYSDRRTRARQQRPANRPNWPDVPYNKRDVNGDCQGHGKGCCYEQG